MARKRQSAENTVKYIRRNICHLFYSYNNLYSPEYIIKTAIVLAIA